MDCALAAVGEKPCDCLFLPGGATLQFAQVPLNLGRQGDYVVTGTWAKKARNSVDAWLPSASRPSPANATICWTCFPAI